MKQSAPQSVLPQSANEFAKHHATALKRNDWGTIAVLASDWCTVKAASAKGEAQPLNAAMLVSQVQRIASLQSSDVWRAVAEIVRTRTQGWAWDKYIKTLLRTCVEDQVKLENWKQVSALLRNMITIGVKARGSALERVRNVSSGKAEDVVIAESKVAFHFLKVVSLLRRETRLKPSDCPRAAARFAMTLPEHMSLDELLEALCKFLATNINRNWQDAAGDLDYFVMKRFLPVKYVDHCEILRNNVTARNKKPAPRLALWAWEFIQEQQDFLQGLLDHALTREDRCRYDYFALQTFRKQYSLKVRDPVYDARLKRKNEGVPFELPEHVFMREAMETTKKEIEARHGGADALQDATRRVQTTFEALAAHKYTHASPTMFNSCTPRNQTASCFLFKISQDSISGIYDILKRCAEVSQCGGTLLELLAVGAHPSLELARRCQLGGQLLFIGPRRCLELDLLALMLSPRRRQLGLQPRALTLVLGLRRRQLGLQPCTLTLVLCLRRRQLGLQPCTLTLMLGLRRRQLGLQLAFACLRRSHIGQQRLGLAHKLGRRRSVRALELFDLVGLFVGCNN